MSILTPQKNGKQIVSAKHDSILTPEYIKNRKLEVSSYNPSKEEKDTRNMVLNHFASGYLTMNTPRVEFNDLSVLQRYQYDMLAFNTYQENNGDAYEGDEIQGWRSNAIRPIVRNQCISIASHATARLIFPKIFAYNRDNDEANEAADVMSDLMEWSCDKSDYEMFTLRRTVAALYEPVSIGHTEYCETYRSVKRPKAEGGYEKELILDEELSGFQDTVIPTDELFIENFYENNIQRQGWLIWRRIISYSLAESKYKAKYDNFKHVKPGIQILYNDANGSFYNVYDNHMSGDSVEEIIYYNRSLDLKLIMVNGVLLTEYDNPNPRNDKLYPFDKFGYEIINNRCFYYKSLAFKLQQDANIVNTLYPMIIDGTYLNLMPPMINKGGEVIGSDVIVPGAVTTLSDDNADLKALSLSQNLKAGQDTLFKVEESINASSIEPFMAGAIKGGETTAYEISRVEQNASTILGLFVKMRTDHIKQYGRLRLGDILQYLTIADVTAIEGAKLTYKTFIIPAKESADRMKTRKISFDYDLPDEPITSGKKLELSRETLKMQGGVKSDVEIWRANPRLMRELTYILRVSPDVLNPRSEELEKAFDLEAYDRIIANPEGNAREGLKMILSAYKRTRKNPEKFLKPEMSATQEQPITGEQPKQLGRSAIDSMGKIMNAQAQGGGSRPGVPGQGMR
jgi:hypothetical protein